MSRRSRGRGIAGVECAFILIHRVIINAQKLVINTHRYFAVEPEQAGHGNTLRTGVKWAPSLTSLELYSLTLNTFLCELRVDKCVDKILLKWLLMKAHLLESNCITIGYTAQNIDNTMKSYNLHHNSHPSASYGAPSGWFVRTGHVISDRTVDLRNQIRY